MERRLPFVLTSFGFPHRMGYLATRAGEYHPSPMGVPDLIQAVRDFGLAGIEIPLPDPVLLPDEQLRDLLQEHRLHLVPDFSSLMHADTETFRIFLERSAALGVPVVRAIMSHILCGERHVAPGGWEAYREAVAARLREVLPLAEDLGLAVALENHQDATSDDLLRLYEMSGSSPAYGITLDAGNPLAVGEEPVEAARRLAPLIRHLHLKDYTMHFAPEGYRLVRCAAGDGVIDFPAILEIVRANGHSVVPGIEIAAQPTRTIPVLDADWWSTYPAPEISRFVGALRLLWAHGHPPHEPYSSAWERGANSATVSAEEWEIVTRSVRYFQGLGGNRDHASTA